MHRPGTVFIFLLLFSFLISPLAAFAAKPAPKGWERTSPPSEEPLERIPPRENAETTPPPQSPLQGVRDMLRTMDALIEAFQEESQTFSRLLDVYRHGGAPWRKLEQCINETWREAGNQEEEADDTP